MQADIYASSSLAHRSASFKYCLLREEILPRFQSLYVVIKPSFSRDLAIPVILSIDLPGTESMPVQAPEVSASYIMETLSAVTQTLPALASCTATQSWPVVSCGQYFIFVAVSDCKDVRVIAGVRCESVMVQ